MLTNRHIFRFWMASKILFCCLLMPKGAFSQVIPDGTTPTPAPGSCAVTCTITGGTPDSLTGGNLFHSFREFSIPMNGMVIFDHGPTVSNIIARVTGDSISSVDGVISTDIASDANVYLINPNGIIFGANGGLEIGGSFLGTTADAIQFGDQGSFSTADTSNNPALLTINPSALVFNQEAPQPIISQSLKPDSSLSFLPPELQILFPPEGLKVQEGNSLLLVGGDIILETPPNSAVQSRLQAPGGRIDLGGLAGPGIVGLNVDGNNLSLSYDNNATFSDIFLNNLDIEISGATNDMPGQVVMTANDISLTNNSGISSTTRSQINAGDIIINADNSLRLIGRTAITSETNSVSGNGGSLRIVTGILVLDANSALRVSTLGGTGNAGNIFIDAEEISLLDRSFILSVAQSLSAPGGNAGSIQIQTDMLSLMGESEISATTTNALDNDVFGVLSIEARDSIFVVDGSAITSETFQQGSANNIAITTPELVIQNSSNISAATSGESQAGNILIQNANAVTVSDNSFISTEVNTNFTGDGGEINIDTQLLTLSDDAQVTSSTAGDGNAGSILIPNASLVSLSNSNITTETTAAGTGGDITLNTNQLTAAAGARITATATATANPTTQGGSVTLNTNQIDLSGQTTGILAETQGPAQAGRINLGPDSNSDSLTINFQDDAQISAATSGDGNGGQILATAPDAIILSGDGRLSALSTSSGSAGDVSIQTNGLLRVQNGALIEASGEGTGASGSVDIISGLTILNDGQLRAATQAGSDSGNIDIKTATALLLRGDSRISAEASNDADGGNVNIAAPFIIALFPEGPNGNDIQASAEAGDGGRIEISTNALFNLSENVARDGNQTNDLDASSGTGIDGEVIIQNLEVDPTEGIEPLTSDTASPEIAQGCQASGNGQFLASGQGGIPPNPYEPISSGGIQEDIDPPGQTIAQQPPLTEPLIEAQDWGRNTKGDIVLTAESSSYHSSCQHSLTADS